MLNEKQLTAVQQEVLLEMQKLGSSMSSSDFNFPVSYKTMHALEGKGLIKACSRGWEEKYVGYELTETGKTLKF